MITLNSKNTGGGAVAALRISSLNGHPSVFCLVETVRKMGSAPGEWVDDQEHRNQVVRCFINGESVELEGKVLEGEAVDAGLVWGVEVEVSMSELLMATRKAGERSQSIQRLRLARVVGVYEGPGKPIWQAKEGRAVRELDQATGKIK